MPYGQTQPGQIQPQAEAPTVPQAVPTATAVVQSRMNLPNAMTLIGYGCSIYWLMGGSSWFAIASIMLDELDGLIARHAQQTTTYGSLLDWGTDIVLTGLVGNRLGILPAIPFITAAQVYLREHNTKPAFGSARAGLTAAVLIKEATLKDRKARLGNL